MKKQKQKELNGKQTFIAMAMVFGAIFCLSGTEQTEISLRFIIGIMLIISATIYTLLFTKIK